MKRRIRTDHSARVRALLLDLFPLTDSMTEANRTFAEVLHWSALVCLLHEAARETELNNLQTLIRLAGDLGYLDSEVVQYLDRQITKLLRPSRHLMSSSCAPEVV